MFAILWDILRIRVRIEIERPYPTKIRPCPDCGSKMYVRKRDLAPSKTGSGGETIRVYKTTIDCRDCGHNFWRGTEESFLGLGLMDEVFQSQ